MRNHQTPSGPLSTIAVLMIFGGSILSIFVDALAWVGIAIALTGLLISFSLLFAQWREERRAKGV